MYLDVACARHDHTYEACPIVLRSYYHAERKSDPAGIRFELRRLPQSALACIETVLMVFFGARCVILSRTWKILKTSKLTGGSNPREARCDGHHEVPRRTQDHRPRPKDSVCPLHVFLQSDLVGPISWVGYACQRLRGAAVKSLKR